jgi:molecular chaperone HtpG
LKTDSEVSENAEISELFKATSGNDQLQVKFEALKNTDIPAILNISEETRRFEDMMRMYGGNVPTGMNNGETLIVNNSSPLILRLSALLGEDADSAKKMASYIYKLSILSQRKLSAEEMQAFLADSFELLGRI